MDARERVLEKCGEGEEIFRHNFAQIPFTLDAAAHIKRSVACSGMTASQVSGGEGLEMSVRMILRKKEGNPAVRGWRESEL